MVIRKITVGGGSSEELYRDNKEEEGEGAALVMYEMLRSVVRRQVRAPFQLLKQLLVYFSSSESSLEAGSQHLRYDL